MSISWNSSVQVPLDVMVSQLASESVLLNLKTESYYGLDDVGTSMWESISTSTTIQSAFDKLIDVYDVDPQTLRDDLTKFLEHLVTNGLIEITPPEMG